MALLVCDNGNGEMTMQDTAGAWVAVAAGSTTEILAAPE